ncbi:indole-3-glycerol-phosphate synthase [Oleidesulfovibrio sp.]|uniref:indole-3-glycerol-phosphate synthase n=1 Tax=Oleidesulfovibrio sp. TaxID=2909707 RepID=UPI003A85ADB9
MLSRFAKAKEAEIAALKELERTGRLPAPYSGDRPVFSQALKKKGIVAITEYKRASPSKGDIELGLEPEDVARAYAQAGAGALSVLTEETYFKGHMNYLDRMAFAGLPMLRKDFILHPLQIVQTAASPASALLLVVRMLSGAEELRMLLDITHKNNMEAVVEVFDEQDLEIAREAGSRIIQVNNRDLSTLQTDLAISSRLVKERDAAECWISASGITEPEHRKYVETLGFDAMLVGTALMAGGDPQGSLARLLQ